MNWQTLAVAVPLIFVAYQSLSRLLPKTTSIFLINAYASLAGLLIMLVLHLLLSPNKSIELTSKDLMLAIGIGTLIGLGNFGIIKAYNLGAPQSIFTPIFYIALIIYGVFVGFLVWHERINFIQIFGVFLSVVGILLVVYFKK